MSLWKDAACRCPCLRYEYVLKYDCHLLGQLNELCDMASTLRDCSSTAVVVACSFVARYLSRDCSASGEGMLGMSLYQAVLRQPSTIKLPPRSIVVVERMPWPERWDVEVQLRWAQESRGVSPMLLPSSLTVPNMFRF